MRAYHERYLSKLKALTPIAGRNVAVLGCSFGLECQMMVREGANAVVGFDLNPLVGQNHADPRITYHNRSITATGEPAGAFDIVYSAAVFEHVHDLPGAMAESVRICKPGGLVFILSSPLWFSPYGNHMVASLEALPWCHLLFSPSALREEILKVLPAMADQPSKLESIVNHVHDPLYFNRLPPASYAAAVDLLQNVDIIGNVFWPTAVAPHLSEIYLPRCLDRGFPEKDLLCGAHFLTIRPKLA
jgi:SAM-dependent methyltransferase